MGLDDLTPVANNYSVPFAFTGTIHEVVIDFEAPQESYLKTGK